MKQRIPKTLISYTDTTHFIHHHNIIIIKNSTQIAAIKIQPTNTINKYIILWKRFIGVLLIYIIILEKIILYHVRVGNFQIPIIIRTFSNSSSTPLHDSSPQFSAPWISFDFQSFSFNQIDRLLGTTNDSKTEALQTVHEYTGQLTPAHTHQWEYENNNWHMEISMFQLVSSYWKTVYTIQFENRGENELWVGYEGISSLMVYSPSSLIYFGI